MSSEPGHRRYLTTLLATAVALGAPLLLSLVLLFVNGETMALDDVVARQQQSGAIYGTAVHGNEREHRLEVIRQTRPAIVGLGSSRMQFRETGFTAPFASAGTVMGTLRHGRDFLERMLAFHRPEIVMLGLDFWWFLDGAKEGPGLWRPIANASDISADKLLKPYDWLYRGRISAGQLGGLMTGALDGTALTPEPKIGIRARLEAWGFRGDGAHYVHAGVPAIGMEEVAHWQAAMVAGAGPYYRHGATVSPARLAELESVLSYSRDQGMTPVVILLPMAGAIVESMAAHGGYAYVAELRQALSSLGVEAYDFHDPRSLGAGDDEFLDHIHPGDVLYLRMLSAILAARPDSALAPYLDAEALAGAIARWRGLRHLPMEAIDPHA